MAPAALWVLLAVGLPLWDAGHAVPAQDALTPYVPEPGSSCRHGEYFDKNSQMCCSMCPPGYRARFFCTDTSDTVCTPCEDSTYTQIWNRVPECLSCGSRCSSDQVETQACTREQDRVCSCRPGRYCMLPTQQGCRLCSELRKCPPGFGVSRPGTTMSNVVCTACAPGTFSDTTSSTDTCKPHRICESTAIPGNANRDAVCASEPLTKTVGPHSALVPQPGPTTKPQLTEPTAGPRTVPSPSDPFSLLTAPVGEVTTGNLSLPIGLIVGLTSLGLLVLVAVNLLIMTQKKKKPFCLQGEAMVPHLPAEKAQGAPGSEQQHLLTTAPSSSSSSLESSASAAAAAAANRRAASGNQPQAPGRDQASGSGDARASSRSSESSSGSPGTQVNVTCIVNVCSSSDHGSQCSSQANSTAGSPDSSPAGSPKDEQVPFSQEECPFRSHSGAPETLPQSTEEKPLSFGVPDAGMKPS
ncbi:TNF receptor superfamily member 1B [Phyllostomus discolor]|uniref:TNF receptor superfamily member 1B n=1 Tax=Phyllostomus discolor TaxID=89673 RepID=A0A834AIL8_9CHIR|nr:TNF receptor superfamily member 1B [Phyllostomus discolor]